MSRPVTIETMGSIEFNEFFSIVQNLRRQGGKAGAWYQFRGTVDGKAVEIKAFKTWLQIFRVDGVRYGGAMELSVSGFNKELAAPWVRS